MNAEEIYKKYVLKEQPNVPVGSNAKILILDDELEIPCVLPTNFFNNFVPIFGPRGSGRTTEEIRKLTPNSFFVSYTQASAFHNNTLSQIPDYNINFISLQTFIGCRQVLGTRVNSGEMVGFDHTVYEALDDIKKFDAFQTAIARHKVCGYAIQINEQAMDKLRKFYYP